jgi:hypothetical protein
LVTYRYKTSHYLINKGLELLATNDKFNAREAYKLFDYVDLINPNFDNVRTYRQQAHEAGMDFVYVVITNQTQQIIPQHLEAELLDFNTYGLNQFWTTYHSKFDDRTDYDFSMQLQLKHINISPERFKERELLREREIIDGWKYLLDNNGNVAKDTLGNDIKIDKIVNARAHFFEILQTKSSEMVANVVFTDLQRQKIIDTFIINSGFTFKNSYGQFKGDINALTNKDKRLLKQEKIPFPSDQQMVYDTAKDLKLQLKGIISPYQLRP